MLFRFSDGDQFNIGGSLRTEHRHGGYAWYGAGSLVPTDDQVEAKKDHGGDGGIRKLSSTTEIVGRRVE